MKTVEWYKGKTYIDEDKMKRSWDTLVEEVQQSAGGTCKSLDSALSEALEYYTAGEITDLDELPEELQEELMDDMHVCPVCEWICYPGEFQCCDSDDEEEEEEY